MPVVEGTDEALASLAKGKSALVWQSLVVDTLTPVAAALKLMENGRGDFLLESVEGGEVRGRYSLIGLAPDLAFRVDDTAASINRTWHSAQTAFVPCDDHPIAALRSLVSECRCEVPASLPPALAFLVGYLSYETIAMIEDIAVPDQDAGDLPRMLFVRPTVLLVFDSLNDTLFCVAPIWHRAFANEGAAAVKAAGDLVQTTIRALRTAPNAMQEVSRLDAALMVQEPQVAANRYREMVTRAQEYIAAGDIFQVVLSQRFRCPFDLPAISLYRALRRINPSPFLFFLDYPGFALIGSSPEILVRVRDDRVTIRPIAGTRPRGRDAAEDTARQDELLADPKERAEHLMLLDLGRNDVGRVAGPGSVAVTHSFMVERYSHVMHIVSNVEGVLRDNSDPIDALLAGFPAGTVSGAPKVRACEIIAELEGRRRGPYAGGVGYFAPDGSLDSCIVLRTGVLRDGMLEVQAGAGIVADSDPAAEQRECEAKAGALIEAAREAVRVSIEEDRSQL